MTEEPTVPSKRRETETIQREVETDTDTDQPRGRPREDAPDYEPTSTDAFTGEALDRLREGRERQLRDLTEAERGDQPETEDNQDATNDDATPEVEPVPAGTPQPEVEPAPREPIEPGDAVA